MKKFDWLKRRAEHVAKFNPYHDERGRFTTARNAVTTAGFEGSGGRGGVDLPSDVGDGPRRHGSPHERPAHPPATVHHRRPGPRHPSEPMRVLRSDDDGEVKAKEFWKV